MMILEKQFNFLINLSANEAWDLFAIPIGFKALLIIGSLLWVIFFSIFALRRTFRYRYSDEFFCSIIYSFFYAINGMLFLKFFPVTLFLFKWLIFAFLIFQFFNNLFDFLINPSDFIKMSFCFFEKLKKNILKSIKFLRDYQYFIMHTLFPPVPSKKKDRKRK